MRIILNVVGVLMMLMGAIWFLQGINILPDSFMTGQVRWAVYGGVSKRPVTPLVLSPIYNLCPTQNSPVLRLVPGERQLDQMRWQLVPTTEPAFTTKLSTINARSETVFESRLYRDLVIRQRCILPLSGMPNAAYRSLCRGADYAE